MDKRFEALAKEYEENNPKYYKSPNVWFLVCDGDADEVDENIG